MIVEGSFSFQGSRGDVWNLLQDPAVLAKALPGAKDLALTGEDRYQGVMRVGVGPVSAGDFSVTIALEDKVPPERYVMKIDSKGSIGFTRGTALVELEDGAGGGTLMKYRADLQIGGKIAGVGQRLLDAASKSMTHQGLEALNRELQARLTGVPEAAAAPRRPVWWMAAAAIVAIGILLWMLL